MIFHLLSVTVTKLPILVISDNLDVMRNDLKQTKSHLQLVKNELKSLQHTSTNEHTCNNCADLSKELQAPKQSNADHERSREWSSMWDSREQLKKSGSRHAMQQQTCACACSQAAWFPQPTATQIPSEDTRQSARTMGITTSTTTCLQVQEPSKETQEDKTTWYWLLPDKCIIHWLERISRRNAKSQARYSKV